MIFLKKLYKPLGLLAIMVFSFYYTEKIAILMQNKSPIMQSINEIENNYKLEAVNASVNDDYIVRFNDDTIENNMMIILFQELWEE